jgi:hypothetical protein
MKFFSNKFLVSFLILAVFLYGISVRVAEAKGVATILTAVVAVVVAVVVVMVVCQVCAVAVASAIGQSAAVGLVYGGIIGASLATIGQVACMSGSSNPMFTGCGGVESTNSGAKSASPINANSGNSPSKCWRKDSTAKNERI